jgi:cation diffusion facilitator CzcD-associated flavoprotein CzcO
MQVVEEYDAVVVCNGHYADPRVPAFPGQEHWAGRQMHSHNYRSPDPFKGARVVVVGVSASGEDISREVAELADQVGPACAMYVTPKHCFCEGSTERDVFPFWGVGGGGEGG